MTTALATLRATSAPPGGATSSSRVGPQDLSAWEEALAQAQLLTNETEQSPETVDTHKRPDSPVLASIVEKHSAASTQEDVAAPQQTDRTQTRLAVESRSTTPPASAHQVLPTQFEADASIAIKTANAGTTAPSPVPAQLPTEEASEPVQPSPISGVSLDALMPEIVPGTTTMSMSPPVKQHVALPATGSARTAVVPVQEEPQAVSEGAAGQNITSPSPPTAEQANSVRLLRHKDGLTLVIRDEVADAHDALRIARSAIGQEPGLAARLRTIVLNGHTLWEHPGEQAQTSPNTLNFQC